MRAFLCSTQQLLPGEIFFFKCVLYVSLVDSNKVKKLPHDVSLSLALVLEKHLRQTINSISMIKFNTKKYSVKKSIDGKGEAIPKYIKQYMLCSRDYMKCTF